MNNTQKLLNNIPFPSKNTIKRPPNTPSQYDDRQHRYFRERNAMFIEDRAYIAGDYFLADVQGLSSNVYDWKKVYIRLADVTSRVDSQAMKTDDFKQVLFKDSWIDYIPLGSKIVCAGSTWLATNPANISAINAKTVVTRCNASYNSYDEYGNVVSEPVYVENQKMLSNESRDQENLMIKEGYFKITAQLNENTAKIRLNRRIVLGTQPYFITGVQDFFQEFTGDRDSTRLVTFTARLDEPTELDDVTENFIANGYAHTFAAEMDEIPTLAPGRSITLAPKFIVDGFAVTPTDEMPVTWEFQSSDSLVVSVENGALLAIDEGEAVVTAVLVQNPNVSVSRNVSVISGSNLNMVAFKGSAVTAVSQYRSATLEAAYYEDLTETAYPLTWAFSGVTSKDYQAVVSADGKSVTITCLSASTTPLTVKASFGQYSAQQRIELEGY